MAKKYKIVFGVDEVGRGSLSGPVFACAIFCFKNLDFEHLNLFRISDFGFRISRIKDSKQLSSRQRKLIYAQVKNDPGYIWAIGRVGERVIDKINIFEASKLAMVRAVKNLEKKLGQKANMLLIDGNFAVPIKRKQKSIIKGDEKEPLIALASIMAKVSRDRMMTRLAKKYPEYGFAKHKGYGTKYHIDMLNKFGPSKIHRMSFAPCKK